MFAWPARCCYGYLDSTVIISASCYDTHSDSQTHVNVRGFHFAIFIFLCCLYYCTFLKVSISIAPCTCARFVSAYSCRDVYNNQHMGMCAELCADT